MSYVLAFCDLQVSIALAQRKDASKRALEDDEASLEKPSGNLICELAAQNDASGLQVDDTILMVSFK